MSNPSFISIDRVSKHFGSVYAVDEVSIDIAQGEFFSLLGASGCGKTTLLRMLAGFESPTLGEIYIDGQGVAEVPPHHRPTNMVFQSYAIFPHLDVRANIAYGLRTAGLTKQEMQERVAEALAMVKLSGFEDRKSHEMSGGQRQRVALARALIKRPKVLLLDEPLGALDKKLREEMQLELRALQKSVGITFIFVTHDQEEALTMSDRIAVMEAGRVLQVASPSDLYEHPNSVAVAGFIGAMNFVDGSVSDVAGGQAKIASAGLGEVVVEADRDFLIKGRNIVLAVRPEKFRISQKPSSDGQGVSGRVSAAAYLGDRSHFYVNIEGREKPLAVSAQNLDRSMGKDMHADQEVWVSWSPSALVVLEP